MPISRIPGSAGRWQSGFCLLRWCESTISAYHQYAYRAALSRSLKQVSPMYFAIEASAPDPRGERDALMHYAMELLK